MKGADHLSKHETGKQAERVLLNLDTGLPENFTREDARSLLNELEQSYRSLDEERAKFVSLYDLAPVGYFILNYLGIITDVNERGVDLLKADKEAVLFKRFQSFIMPESWESFYSFLHQTESCADRQSTEIKLLLGNNEIAYTRVEGIAVQNSIAKQIKYYIAVIDVTESRKSQLKLQETKDRLEMTLSASSTGIWTIDSFDHKVYLDDYSYAILGFNPEEFDGSIKYILQFIHPDDQEKMRYSLGQGIVYNEYIDLEFRVLNGEEFKYIAFKGHEVSDPKNDGRCFAGILMDVTQRKLLEQEAENLRKNQQRLILSATLMAQEKERSIISNALHDSVCQILYGIRLNLQNYQITHQIKEEFVNVKQLLDQAIRETRQLSYELTPSVLKDFGFTAGIREMSQRLSMPSFQIRCSISSAADHLPPPVQLYLFRIIQELVNNAIKHSKASQLEIRVKVEPDKQLSIVVADNGKGINMPEQEAFKKGSGLRGIKNRVFLLDGEISFQSDVRGTSITILFKNDLHLSTIERV